MKSEVYLNQVPCATKDFFLLSCSIEHMRSLFARLSTHMIYLSVSPYYLGLLVNSCGSLIVKRLLNLRRQL